jgi:hypothetical protein
VSKAIVSIAVEVAFDLLIKEIPTIVLTAYARRRIHGRWPRPIRAIAR